MKIRSTEGSVSNIQQRKNMLQLLDFNKVYKLGMEIHQLSNSGMIT